MLCKFRCNNHDKHFPLGNKYKTVCDEVTTVMQTFYIIVRRRFILSISIYLVRFASSWQSKRNSIKPNTAGHVKADSH